uniref:Uncharacterized protein n=1 Tax=Vespula pensylvanica TaxID=30213 RepID=A0A834NSG2_VESPE|nr:hypothetical protein H0235_011657 [Vespula pensylvanica]
MLSFAEPKEEDRRKVSSVIETNFPGIGTNFGGVTFEGWGRVKVKVEEKEEEEGLQATPENYIEGDLYMKSRIVGLIELREMG